MIKLTKSENKLVNDIILTVIKNHTYNNPISNISIRNLIDVITNVYVSNTSINARIKKLTNEHPIIGSCNSGWFMIDSQKALEVAQEYLVKKIVGHKKRLDDMTEEFNNFYKGVRK